MKIFAVIVTCNRVTLLPRALNSVKTQKRMPDCVYVVSNSNDDNFLKEQELCAELGFSLFRNRRTGNYAGALNTAVEQMIQANGVSNDMYFASLDDDDEWLPNYLQEIEENNTENYDLLAGYLLRSSSSENNLLALPNTLSEKDFLVGNPGISGSNTFINLLMLLQAGAFDEALAATIDRDFFVRVFLQKPTYKIIPKPLATQHTDNDRERVTTNHQKKAESLRFFLYKYQHLMTESEREKFFERAEKLFSIPQTAIMFPDQPSLAAFTEGELVFEQKGDFQFIIGFITSDEKYAERAINQILSKNISVDLVVIINNSQNSLLEDSTQLLAGKVPYRIIHPAEWKHNLRTAYYGSAFSEFTEINSIPLGRTILHYHLHTETAHFSRPIYWIIDDDITFNFIKLPDNIIEKIDVFSIVSEHSETMSAMIGSISNDPALPALSIIRSQLVDFLHSHWANNQLNQDLLGLRTKADYYYDLSDMLSNHLECPIYHTQATEGSLEAIFGGKSISRKLIQKPEIATIERTVTQRGGNTLVFNRELLRDYPVINVNVNRTFARRGDLLWVLLNQVVSGHRIVEHTFAIQHTRIIGAFNLPKELEKSAYDIIGYAFNKGFLHTVQKIKTDKNITEPQEILETLNTTAFFTVFFHTYKQFLQTRKVKFLMNYYRVIGLLKILSCEFEYAQTLLQKMSEKKALDAFLSLVTSAESEETLKNSIRDLATDIGTYSNAVENVSELTNRHQSLIEQYFGLKTGIKLLGSGSEGIVFSDGTWVYKSFFNMSMSEWEFLKTIAPSFSGCSVLENIDCFEQRSSKFIRYPFHPFQVLDAVREEELIHFLRFCKLNCFIFTNIAPKNFIQTLSGQIKLIDYGRSFEPFTEEKFVNATKRAFLLLRFPKMQESNFKKITQKINSGEVPTEINGWELFYQEVLKP